MKSDKNIFIAFILNLLFSIIELFGGFLTNSVAIMSDSIHDLGDSLSIGLSYILENISKKEPDNKYTYGYIRYSVIGSLITSIILLFGSIFVIYNAILRIINPVTINYNGMILLAILGFVINLLAAFFTREGESINQKSVNLHMLEDVLGWLIVLIGAILMKFTNFAIIDPILSLFVALFIGINAFKNLKLIIDLFLEKTPRNINIDKIKERLLNIKNVTNIHHIHIWSIDGYKNYATLHVVIEKNTKKIKDEIRECLKHFDINHVTIEVETKDEICGEEDCKIETKSHKHHHH